MPTIEMTCPKCGGNSMWDNRTTKKNPAAPDYKCANRACDGVVWPPRAGNGAPAPAAAPTTKQAFSQGPALPYEQETGAPPAESTTGPFAAAFAKYDACLAHAVERAARYPTASLDITAMAATLFINVSR